VILFGYDDGTLEGLWSGQNYDLLGLQFNDSTPSDEDILYLAHNRLEYLLLVMYLSDIYIS